LGGAAPDGTLRFACPDPRRGSRAAARPQPAHGYAQVTVADVVRRARVSRTAFYAHFHDKQDCFFAATTAGAEMLFTATVAAVNACADDTDDEELLRVGVRAFLRFLADEPAFARVFYVDLPAAGDRAVDRLQSAYERWGVRNRIWHERARMRHPDWPLVPPEVYLALAGATGELVRERVRRGAVAELPELEDVLVGLHLAVLAGRLWPPAHVRLPAQASVSVV
jgi:AcrR family transcriptional regulator